MRSTCVTFLTVFLLSIIHFQAVADMSVIRFRGFNLHAMADKDWAELQFKESDFRIISRFGFNFVRIPVDSRLLFKNDNPDTPDEKYFRELDLALKYADKYNLYISIDMHRLAGYHVVEPDATLIAFWKSEEKQKLAAKMWGLIALRYKGKNLQKLSFNLLNEPRLVSGDQYKHFVNLLSEQIRKVDSKRFLIVDAFDIGRLSLHSDKDVNVIYATRGYEPLSLTHYRSTWIPNIRFTEPPTWPLSAKDQEKMLEYRKDFSKSCPKGLCKALVGEFGTFHFTSHSVALNWMQDSLQYWKEQGYGWALWNLRGPFGILDSTRTDIKYEKFEGHLLDRKMLNLLQKY